MIPPAVSIPRERGTTSRRRMSWVFADLFPPMMEACTAAPKAMASSGLIDLLGSRPLKKSFKS